MARTHRTAGRGRVLALATAAVLALGMIQTPVANAGNGYRAKLLRIINDTRMRHDLHRVKLNRSLSRESRAHTRRMINADRIFDPPNLAEILARYRWDDLGADVVGCGNTLRQLHQILLSEAFHREIMLHPALRRVGVGVIRADERNRCGHDSFWATAIYFG